MSSSNMKNDDDTLDEETIEKPSSIQDDWPNILLLILLYTIQGIPMGLAFGSIPFLLQSKATYTQLGIFSLSNYPYSLKLLWSPFVDTLYFKFCEAIGRRKSWILPIQFITGILLLLLSAYVNDLFNVDHFSNSHIFIITSVFFVIVTLMATQDVRKLHHEFLTCSRLQLMVRIFYMLTCLGWALTILKRHNLSYASSCQTIGLTLGYYMSYTVFLALNSPEFCNAFLRSTPEPEGIVNLSGYLFIWGCIFIVFTIIIAIVKKEPIDFESSKYGIAQVYRQLLSIVALPKMRSLLLLLLTCKLGFVVSDSITPLKLVEKGFRKDNLALIVTLAFPIESILAIFVAKWAKGNPLDIWGLGYTLRLLMAFTGVCIVFYYPSKEELSAQYFIFIMLYMVLYAICSNLMFVALGAFFTSIADNRIGGSYVTLLNTFANLGGTYPKFFVFYFVDYLSIHGCRSENGEVSSWGCSQCAGKCASVFDGYYTLAVFGLVAGLTLMFGVYKRSFKQLQDSQQHEWKVQLQTAADI